MSERPWLLVAVEMTTAASALYGGIGLALNDAIGMPDTWLRNSPFDSWLLPGVLLVLVVAVPMSVAAAMEVARGGRAWLMSEFAGVVLVGWIVVEVLLMRRYNVLQPVMAAVGLLVVLLARQARPQRHVTSRSESRPATPTM